MHTLRSKEITSEISTFLEETSLSACMLLFTDSSYTSRGPWVNAVQAQFGLSKDELTALAKSCDIDGKTIDLSLSDRIAHYLLKQTLPTVWCYECLKPCGAFDDLTPVEKAAIDARRSLGWTCGLSIPVHLPQAYDAQNNRFTTVIMTGIGRTIGDEGSFLRGTLSSQMIQARHLYTAHRLSQLCFQHLPWLKRETVVPHILTRRERQCLELATSCRTVNDIADNLSLHVETIRTYLKSSYRKLEVNTRTEAVLKAMELGEIRRNA